MKCANVVAAALFAVLLCSCGAPPENVQELQCPQPPVHSCMPGTFATVRFDTTTSIGPDTRDYYYKIIHLDTPINTPGDQWGMAFYKKGQAVYSLLTDQRDPASQRQSVTTFKSVSPADSPEQFNNAHNLGSGGDFNVVNAGSCAIDEKTMTIYFAAPRPGGTRGDYDIYSGRLKRDGDAFVITGAAPLSDNVNKEMSWDAQPAISPDGQTLYFASDRPGGVGGTDIWCSKKHAGEWGAAVNCGTGVNTECDELTPFVSPDGNALYFSSSGHATVGGYDIFSAGITASGISDAVNIGEPVNTPADELFPSTYSDSLLYYASNQTGGDGGFDMYMLKLINVSKRSMIALASPEKKLIATAPDETVTPKKLLPPPPKPVAPTPPPAPLPVPPKKTDSSLVIGTVVNARTHEPIDSAVVTVHLPPPDSIVNTMMTNADGKFEIKLSPYQNYQLVAQAPNYFYGVFDEPPAEDSIVRITLALPETLMLRLQFPVNDSKHPYEKTLSDSGLPSALAWSQEIDLLASNLITYKNRIMAITLVGNTDSSASDKYNDRLGLWRAQFVKDQLIARGVPANMLVVRSDGRRNPLPRKPDEPEELYRARCRRTEIAKITERRTTGNNKSNNEQQ